MMDGYLYNDKGINFVIDESSNFIKNGDDLIVKTIFISNSGSAKTVTTTETATGVASCIHRYRFVQTSRHPPMV